MVKAAVRATAVTEKELRALRVILAVSVFLNGLYSEFFAALAAAALLVWLWRRKELALRLHWPLLAVAFLFLGSGLSCFWAVDRGLAPFGLTKTFPLLLMALCLQQLNEAQRSRCLDDLPALGALMVVLSYPLQFVPVISDYFCVSGRLAGFFQYPNSFACFLLLGLERLFLTLGEPKKAPLRIAEAAALCFGLIQSGSRAVFVLALMFLGAFLFVSLRGKRLRASLPLLGGVMIGLALCWPASLLSAAALQHLGELSPGASTFLGRLLYAKDALPVILRHPLGLGYLGYWMSQGSFQHGVYAVRWVHNDLLQLFLDYGWLPALAAAAAGITSLLSKRGGASRRVLLLTLLAHCLFDFDLAFDAIFFVLLLLLDWEAGKEKRLRPGLLPRVMAALCAAVLLWLGAAASAEDLNPDLALKLYPRHSSALSRTLPTLPDTVSMARRADQILALDNDVTLAWDAKALYAYQQGDFQSFILAKREALRCSPYAQEEYDDAVAKLKIGEMLYRQAGDEASAAICRQEIESIRERMQTVLDTTDPLAWRLADKPSLVFPGD